MRDGGEYQPTYKATERVKLSELRVVVGEALASLFVPDGQSWALLNPVGADSVLSAPKQKPLRAAILDHIGGGTRRALFSGKRRLTKSCVVILPSPMTRVLAIRARDAKHAADVQSQLANIGLTSFSYPLCAQNHFLDLQTDPTTKKVGRPKFQIFFHLDKADYSFVCTRWYK